MHIKDLLEKEKEMSIRTITNSMRTCYFYCPYKDYWYRTQHNDTCARTSGLCIHLLTLTDLFTVSLTWYRAVLYPCSLPSPEDRATDQEQNGTTTIDKIPVKIRDCAIIAFSSDENVHEEHKEPCIKHKVVIWGEHPKLLAPTDQYIPPGPTLPLPLCIIMEMKTPETADPRAQEVADPDNVSGRCHRKIIETIIRIYSGVECLICLKVWRFIRNIHVFTLCSVASALKKSLAEHTGQIRRYGTALRDHIFS